MVDDLIARHARSFGPVAAEYAEHRPDYPDAAVSWALEPVPRPPCGPPRVLDLGAGTGKLTEALVRSGVSVTAVEPDEGMLAELRRRIPLVPALTGTAEAIPLPDASVDAIACGLSLHWFDQERAVPEMARVLRAGGVAAALWNSDDETVPWVRELQEVSRWRTLPRTKARWERLALLAGFGPTERAEFRHVQRRTADSLAATIATHSHVLVLPEDERAELIGRVRDYLRSRPETSDGEFEVPIVTKAFRSVRS
jgi:SAM-dependent methyltransferase